MQISFWGSGNSSSCSQLKRSRWGEETFRFSVLLNSSLLIKLITQVCVSGCVFTADSGRSSSSSTKGERLSAKMRSLPGSNEPYEASSQKELGEESVQFPSNSERYDELLCFPQKLWSLPSHRTVCETAACCLKGISAKPGSESSWSHGCRCVVRGPAGASDGQTKDGGQEAGGWRRLCRRRSGRRPATGVDPSTGRALPLLVMSHWLETRKKRLKCSPVKDHIYLRSA